MSTALAMAPHQECCCSSPAPGVMLDLTWPGTVTGIDQSCAMLCPCCYHESLQLLATVPAERGKVPNRSDSPCLASRLSSASSQITSGLEHWSRTAPVLSQGLTAELLFSSLTSFRPPRFVLLTHSCDSSLLSQ